MPKTIEYKKEFFDLLNDLTSINNSIGIEREDDKIVVRKFDKSKTLPYILTAPNSYFNIENTVCFYNFSNFYRYMEMIKDPQISITETDGVNDKIKLFNSSARVNYILSEKEGIINGPAEVEFGESDITFTLLKDELDEICKMNNLIKAEIAEISCKGNKVIIKIFSDENGNSFEKAFKVERLTDYDEDIEFKILSKVFGLLPSKKDYNIFIKKEKYIKFDLVHDEIDLMVYSGAMDDE